MKLPQRIKDLILQQFKKNKLGNFAEDQQYLQIAIEGVSDKIPTDNTEDFWMEIYKKNYKPFYEKYGFTGEITNYPSKIVFAMCDEQVRQGNQWSVEAFEKDASATINKGGFNWSVSKKGFDYWNTIWETLYNQSEKKSTQNISSENNILLKSGMVVIFRGGWCGVLFDYKGKLKIMCPELETVIDIESYNPDFTIPSNNNLDIMKAGYVSLDKICQFTKGDIDTVFEHKEPTYYKISDDGKNFYKQDGGKNVGVCCYNGKHSFISHLVELSNDIAKERITEAEFMEHYNKALESIKL